MWEGVWRGRELVGDERGRQMCGVGDREKRRERKRKEQLKLKTTECCLTITN